MWKPVSYLMFNCGLLIFVQMYFNQLGTIELDPDTFANNFCGEYQIFQDGIVDGSQGAGSWALLFVWVGASTTWFGQNFTFSHEDDMLAREFLLQLTDQARLDLLEGLLLWYGNVDDDCLFAAEFNFACPGNVQVAQLWLQVGVHLELQ